MREKSVLITAIKIISDTHSLGIPDIHPLGTITYSKGIGEESQKCYTFIPTPNSHSADLIMKVIGVTIDM